MKWYMRGYGSWYLKTDRKDTGNGGTIIAHVWLAGDKWMWSSMSGRSSTGCQNCSGAKKAARRSLSNDRILR